MDTGLLGVALNAGSAGSSTRPAKKFALRKTDLNSAVRVVTRYGHEQHVRENL